MTIATSSNIRNHAIGMVISAYIEFTLNDFARCYKMIVLRQELRDTLYIMQQARHTDIAKATHNLYGNLGLGGGQYILPNLYHHPLPKNISVLQKYIIRCILSEITMTALIEGAYEAIVPFGLSAELLSEVELHALQHALYKRLLLMPHKPLTLLEQLALIEELITDITTE